MKVRTELRIIIKSLLLAYAITGGALLLVAFLLFQMEPEESMVLAGIQVIYVLGSFVCGFVAGKGIRKKRLLWGMAAGVCYSVSLTGVSMFRWNSVWTWAAFDDFCPVSGWWNAGGNPVLKMERVLQF